MGFCQTPFISVFNSQEFSNSSAIGRNLDPISVLDFYLNSMPFKITDNVYCKTLVVFLYELIHWCILY